MLSEKEERAMILRKVLELNTFLTQEDIRTITKKPERTVSYWFKDERVIDEISLVLLKQALSLSCNVIPRELNRYISRIYNHPKVWAKKNHSGKEKPEYKGAIIGQRHRAKKFYIYDGSLMSVKAISIKKSMTTNKIYSLIISNKIKVKSDITQIIDNCL